MSKQVIKLLIKVATQVPNTLPYMWLVSQNQAEEN